MKKSCIMHPPKTRIAVLREDYLSICDNYIAAALLLSFFEYWHNIRLEQSQKAQEANLVAEMHGEKGTQDTSLLQFHTAKELHTALMGLVGRNSIENGILLLEQKGYITIHKNPNPRYKFDKTRFFLLHPDKVNTDITKLVKSINQNGNTATPKMSDGNTENVETIPVTTTITTSITAHNKNNNISDLNSCQTNQDNNIEIPDALNNPEFKKAWNDWIIHRKEIKKKLTPTAMKKQLKFLSEQPDPVKCIEQSIMNGWQGLFPYKQETPKCGYTDEEWKRNMLKRIREQEAKEKERRQ